MVDRAWSCWKDMKTPADFQAVVDASGLFDVGDGEEGSVLQAARETYAGEDEEDVVGTSEGRPSLYDRVHDFVSTLERPGSRLMVRSSSNEDCAGASNAGGNASFAGVPASTEAVFPFVLRVIRSYFSARSLAQRTLSCDSETVMAQRPLLSVLLQRMVGEESSPIISSAGVLYTEDPAAIDVRESSNTAEDDQEHPRIALVSASWGHNTGVVDALVATDTFLIHEATGSTLSSASSVSPFPWTIVPQLERKHRRMRAAAAGQGSLGAMEFVDNPLEIAESPSLSTSELVELGNAGRLLSTEKEGPYDVEFVVQREAAGAPTRDDRRDHAEFSSRVCRDFTIYIVQRRPLDRRGRSSGTVPSFLPDTSLSGVSGGPLRAVQVPLPGPSMVLGPLTPEEVLFRPDVRGAWTTYWDRDPSTGTAVVEEEDDRASPKLVVLTTTVAPGSHYATMFRKEGIPVVVLDQEAARQMQQWLGTSEATYVCVQRGLVVRGGDSTSRVVLASQPGFYSYPLSGRGVSFRSELFLNGGLVAVGAPDSAGELVSVEERELPGGVVADPELAGLLGGRGSAPSDQELPSRGTLADLDLLNRCEEGRGAPEGLEESIECSDQVVGRQFGYVRPGDRATALVCMLNVCAAGRRRVAVAEHDCGRTTGGVVDGRKEHGVNLSLLLSTTVFQQLTEISPADHSEQVLLGLNVPQLQTALVETAMRVAELMQTPFPPLSPDAPSRGVDAVLPLHRFQRRPPLSALAEELLLVVTTADLWGAATGAKPGNLHLQWREFVLALCEEGASAGDRRAGGEEDRAADPEGGRLVVLRDYMSSLMGPQFLQRRPPTRLAEQFLRAFVHPAILGKYFGSWLLLTPFYHADTTATMIPLREHAVAVATHAVTQTAELARSQELLVASQTSSLDDAIATTLTQLADTDQLVLDSLRRGVGFASSRAESNITEWRTKYQYAVDEVPNGSLEEVGIASSSFRNQPWGVVTPHTKSSSGYALLRLLGEGQATPPVARLLAARAFQEFVAKLDTNIKSLFGGGTELRKKQRAVSLLRDVLKMLVAEVPVRNLLKHDFEHSGLMFTWSVFRFLDPAKLPNLLGIWLEQYVDPALIANQSLICEGKFRKTKPGEKECSYRPGEIYEQLWRESGRPVSEYMPGKGCDARECSFDAYAQGAGDFGRLCGQCKTSVEAAFTILHQSLVNFGNLLALGGGGNSSPSGQPSGQGAGPLVFKIDGRDRDVKQTLSADLLSKLPRTLADHFKAAEGENSMVVGINLDFVGATTATTNTPLCSCGRVMGKKPRYRLR